jgi:hypothetical protein
MEKSELLILLNSLSSLCHDIVILEKSTKSETTNCQKFAFVLRRENWPDNSIILVGLKPMRLILQFIVNNHHDQLLLTSFSLVRQ